MQTTNVPEMRLGVVGVSRDCFPASLTRNRLAKLAGFLKKRKVPCHVCGVVVENETDSLAALRELADAGANALFVFLGNFGPEGPSTLLMQRFPGPAMVAAAAEEDSRVLASDRGDALCGLLNNSYNQKLRGLRSYIPARPVGSPEELAGQAAEFVDIARVVVGLKNLKIISFGPRPQDFMACNAPLAPLYELGIEAQENSELDLLAAYREAAGETGRVKEIAEEMRRELRGRNPYPDLLPKLAQFETALLAWRERNAGASRFVVFANKCWPAFEPMFGFVPCYVNSRLAGRGMPVACEVDLYGAVSEYMATCATLRPATLLDINNSVPDDLVGRRNEFKGAGKKDLFMGFHCGNTCLECLEDDASLRYQLIMNRGLEKGGKPDITRGTLEGTLKAGPVTFFRLQSNPVCALSSYIAEGEILDLPPRTFGGVGVFAIPGFARFYRHVLVAKGYPHHGAVAFGKTGRVLFEAVKLLGVDDIAVPLPDSLPYPGENLFDFCAAKRR